MTVVAPASLKRQFAAIVTARVVGSAMQAVSFVLLGRGASVVEVGAVGIVIGAGGFAGALFDCGMSSYISRSRAMRRDDVVAVGLRLNAITSTVFGMLTTLVLLLLAGWTVLPFAVIGLGLGMAVEKNVETALAVPIADGDRRRPALSVLIRRMVTLALFLLLRWIGLEVVFAYTAAYAAGGIAGQVHIRRFLRGAVPRGLPDGPTLVTVARSGLPFLVSNVAGQARSLDAAIVGIVASPFQAGLYSAANRLSTPLLLIPATLTTLIVPHAVRRSARDVRRLAAQLVGLFLATLVPFGVLALASRPIVHLLFGGRFDAAAPAFAIALVALPFIALSPPLGSLLQGKGHEHFVAINGLLFAGLLIVAMVAGARLLGATGVAAAIGVVFVAKCISLGLAIRGRIV